jgi:hypothetical protein
LSLWQLTFYSPIASGLLGRDVVPAFQRLQWRVVGTGLTRTNPPNILKLDLLDKSNIVSILDEVKCVQKSVYEIRIVANSFLVL